VCYPERLVLVVSDMVPCGNLEREGMDGNIDCNDFFHTRISRKLADVARLFLIDESAYDTKTW